MWAQALATFTGTWCLRRTNAPASRHTSRIISTTGFLRELGEQLIADGVEIHVVFRAKPSLSGDALPESPPNVHCTRLTSREE